MAKRSLSDSDCDDLFSDHKDSCLTPPETCGHQTVSRKKRRGIIEKRRRDRINNSLSELRRLVPTAFEKQGSAKLEKAEILQMTVDHLKMIHSKGFDALAYDPQKFALDYHALGFRECYTETGKFLVRSEGMGTQDPFYQKLMSHLHNALAHRELANKQAASSSWTPSYPFTHSTNNITVPPQHTPLMDPPEQYIPNTNIHMEHTHQTHHHHQINHGTMNVQDRNPIGNYQIPGYTFQNPVSNNNSSYVPNGKQPYRPWGGAELAY